MPRAATRASGAGRRVPASDRAAVGGGARSNGAQVRAREGAERGAGPPRATEPGYGAEPHLNMFDKLAAEEQRYEELMQLLGTTEVQSDQSVYRKHAKALADVEPLVERFREYKSIVHDLMGAEELAASGDPEMRELAKEEMKSLAARRDALGAELKIMLVPKDPNDEKNVVLEIRAGTGGDEAALFAGE